MYISIGKFKLGTNPVLLAIEAALGSVHDTNVRALLEKSSELTAAELARLTAVIGSEEALIAEANRIYAEKVAAAEAERNGVVTKSTAKIAETSQAATNAKRNLDLANQALDEL